MEFGAQTLGFDASMDDFKRVKKIFGKISVFSVSNRFFKRDFGAKIGKSGFKPRSGHFLASEASSKHREAMRGPEGPVRSTARPRSGLFEPRSGVLSREAAF